MKKEVNEAQPKLNRSGGRNEKVRLTPKFYRRAERARKNRDAKRRNDHQLVGSNKYVIGLGNIWGASAIYFPKRRKLKGWQKENRRHRKAA